MWESKILRTKSYCQPNYTDSSINQRLISQQVSALQISVGSSCITELKRKILHFNHLHEFEQCNVQSSYIIIVQDLFKFSALLSNIDLSVKRISVFSQKQHTMGLIIYLLYSTLYAYNIIGILSRMGCPAHFT